MRIEEVIGAHIERKRVEFGWTQAQLSEALLPVVGKRWTRQAVGDAENGRRSFTALELCALSIVLNVPIGDLFITDATVETPGGAELGELEVAQLRGHVKVANAGGSLETGTFTDEKALMVDARLDDIERALRAANRAIGATRALTRGDDRAR